MKFDLNLATKDDDYIPLFSFYLFKTSIFIFRKPSFGIDVVETQPYALDGECPYTFLDAGWVCFMTEWKWLYKILYKRKNGYAAPYFKEEK